MMERLAEQDWASHRQSIYRFIRRRTGSDDVAHELTQEVLADALSSLDRFDPTRCTPLLAWLHTIAKRRLVDAARRAARDRRFLVPIDAREIEAPPTYGSNVGRAITKASRRLPPEDRRLLKLRLIRGLSFAELSDRTGTTEAALRMRYMRALRVLRAELERGGFKP